MHWNLESDERLDQINENLQLIQKKDGLTFGTDAYLLAAFAKPKPRGTMVDLGSGTGVASLLCMTRKKYAAAYAVELQPEFCRLIERNCVLNGLENQIHVIQRDIRLLGAADLDDSVTTVLTNPPYLPDGSGFPCANLRMETARRELNGTIQDFCATSARLLQSGGLLYVVYRPERMPELMTALRQEHLEPKRMVTVYPDMESKPCLILVEAKKDAAPSLLQAPPLIIYRSAADRTYTSCMQRIYDTFSMDFLFQP